MSILQSRRLKTIMFGLLTILSSFVVGYGIAMTARNNFSAPLPPNEVILTLTGPTATPAVRRTAVLAAHDSAEEPSATPTTATPSATDTAQITATLPAEQATTAPRSTLRQPIDRPTATLTAVADQATPTPLEHFVSDSFESSASGWLIRDGARSSAAYVGGGYRLRLTGQPDLGVSSTVRSDAYYMSADVTIGKGSAGLVFLSAAPTIFYRFVITNDGAYAVQSRAQDAASPTNLAGWSESSALRRGPDATNRLRVERVGLQVRCYANEQLLTALTLPDQDFTGQYGFALASDDGQGEATFDNLLGEYLKQP